MPNQKLYPFPHSLSLSLSSDRPYPLALFPYIYYPLSLNELAIPRITLLSSSSLLSPFPLDLFHRFFHLSSDTLYLSRSLLGFGLGLGSGLGLRLDFLDRSEHERRRPALAAHLRALRHPPHHPPVPSRVAGPGAGSDAAEDGSAGEEAPGEEDAGLAGGFRGAAPRGVAGDDAVRVGDVRDRVHTDAVGDRARRGVLLRRDRFEYIRIWEGDSLPQFSFVSEGDLRSALLKTSNCLDLKLHEM